MFDTVLQGGHVVLETGALKQDVAVTDGMISAIGESLTADAGTEILDATGLVVLPGLVDAHVHFNEPGRTHWEGWETGTRGAAAGGVTTVLEMPLNASPPTTTRASFAAKRDAAGKSALVDYGLWGGFVDDNSSHFDALKEQGIVALKAFMCESGIDDFAHVPSELLASGIAKAARLGLLVGVHAEDNDITSSLTKEMHAGGRTDRGAWGESRPRRAEAEAIAEALDYVRRAGNGARLHVVHVSSGDALAVIEGGKAANQAVTAETCPHYLAFTEDDFDRIGPALKCAPPLRDEANRRSLWSAVLAGTIDSIGSDHSPCPAEAKLRGEDDVWQAWGGVSGIQATLPVMITEGIHQRGLGWERLADLLCTNPAKIFGLYPSKGAIRVGADADFTLVDPEVEWTFSSGQLETRSGISPYIGTRFRGAVVRTIVRGRTVFRHGSVVGDVGYGRFVRPALKQ